MRIFAALFGFVLLAGVAGAVGVLYLLHQYSKELPEYHQLAEYDPPTVTRVHAGDGRLLTEYAIEKRVFVPIQAMPGRILNAFISAEDKHFYQHQGVDFQAVGRAVFTNIFNYIRGRRPVGASTITQQVAKNFLLTNEVSYERKLKEAILAFRIERAFTKDRILELYLNEIYLGLGSYGVAAASLKYFGKSLDELSIAEAAYLAALPKAPNNYHPILATEAAIGRRNWVIGRMLSDGRVSPDEAEEAAAEPLVVKRNRVTLSVDAGYFAEEVRRELVDLYGENRLYQGGLSVRTTLDARLQMAAERALRQGLIDYDRRHGWRGAPARFDLEGEVDWQKWLAEDFQTPAGVGDWQPAVVLEAGKKEAKIGLKDGTTGFIPLAEVKWASPWLEDQTVGKAPGRVNDVLKSGDVILVEAVEADAEGKAYDVGAFGLRQIPDVDGGIVAMDPHTGRVLAMVGGFSFRRSEFNRVTQAKRQPGSAFKPIVYLAGLDNGFTPATLILDAPFVIDQGEDKGLWKPDNYSNKFYGPTPMRVGIEKSRNLMTVRLAETIGMKAVSDYAKLFGVVDYMPRVLAMALGSGETTLMRLTTAYAMLVNGGKRITPSLIDRVQDKNGLTVFRHDTRECPGCSVETWNGQRVPFLADEREQIADPSSAYQVVAMLQGVIKRGTGRRIASLGRPLAGKTGTTNDNRDTWFVGFSPDLAVGVFIGFDEPKSLGPKETGSSVAAPVFKFFMGEALKNQPKVPFRIPPGIRIVRINAETGQVARSGDKQVYLEAFKPGTVPTGRQTVVDGGYNPQGNVSDESSTGGLY